MDGAFAGAVPHLRRGPAGQVKFDRVTHQMTHDDDFDERRRRIRRTTLLLVLVALGIYVAFIVSSMMQAQP
jgi:hypothetical protein